jgi:hypothetical protein
MTRYDRKRQNAALLSQPLTDLRKHSQQRSSHYLRFSCLVDLKHFQRARPGHLVNLDFSKPFEDSSTTQVLQSSSDQAAICTPNVTDGSEAPELLASRLE